MFKILKLNIFQTIYTSNTLKMAFYRLNSTNINESIKLIESYNRLLEKNYNDTKAKMNRQWEM